MNNIKTMIASMVISGFKKDKVVICLSEFFSEDPVKAINAYTGLCEILLGSGMTLSEYFSKLTVRDDEALFTEYFHNKSELLKNNISHDIDIISRLSEITANELICDLHKRFEIPDSITFPEYENGTTDISFEKACMFREFFGKSLFADNKAFIYNNGHLESVRKFDNIRLSELKGYEVQREAVIENTRRFIANKPYSSVLLYGDRGTGKSCTVKAIVNEFPELRIVLVPKSAIMQLYDIYDLLSRYPLKFILFLDDTSFESNDPEYNFLKQALEGSVYIIPKNCAIYATTNRRHIIKETLSEREDEHNAADARDEKASLADRFGLYITFMPPDKKGYLDIVEQIATDRGIDIDKNELFAQAERLAVRKGSRSPRTARQLVDMLDNN